MMNQQLKLLRGVIKRNDSLSIITVAENYTETVRRASELGIDAKKYRKAFDDLCKNKSLLEKLI